MRSPSLPSPLIRHELRCALSYYYKVVIIPLVYPLGFGNGMLIHNAVYRTSYYIYVLCHAQLSVCVSLSSGRDADGTCDGTNWRTWERRVGLEGGAGGLREF